MASAGEVMHAIGQAYQSVFIAALEGNIRPFENKFDVRTEPSKTSFRGRDGNNFSFDFAGVYNHPWKKAEVFGECKGYSRGSALLSEYREFLAKAYVTSVDYPRQAKDYFWFVTNVPFACTEGTRILTFNFVKETLTDSNNSQLKPILSNGHIDTESIRSLVPRIGVFILTDSYLMNTRLSYRVSEGENLWTILKKLHAGQAPSGFGPIAQQIASRNGLPSPDIVRSGERLELNWFGIERKIRDLNRMTDVTSTQIPGAKAP